MSESPSLIPQYSFLVYMKAVAEGGAWFNTKFKEKLDFFSTV